MLVDVAMLADAGRCWSMLALLLLLSLMLQCGNWERAERASVLHWQESCSQEVAETCLVVSAGSSCLVVSAGSSQSMLSGATDAPSEGTSSSLDDVGVTGLAVSDGSSQSVLSGATIAASDGTLSRLDCIATVDNA